MNVKTEVIACKLCGKTISFPLLQKHLMEEHGIVYKRAPIKKKAHVTEKKPKEKKVKNNASLNDELDTQQQPEKEFQS